MLKNIGISPVLETISRFPNAPKKTCMKTKYAFNEIATLLLKWKQSYNKNNNDNNLV